MISRFFENVVSIIWSFEATILMQETTPIVLIFFQVSPIWYIWKDVIVMGREIHKMPSCYGRIALFYSVIFFFIHDWLMHHVPLFLLPSTLRHYCQKHSCGSAVATPPMVNYFISEWQPNGYHPLSPLITNL